MITGWRTAAAACCALAITLGTAPATSAAERREMLAGHWHLMFYGKCIISATNQQACRDLQGPAQFAVIDVPGSTLMVHGTGDYVSDKRGRYTVRFVTSITERAPGRVPVAQCSNATVFDSTFSGTCRESGTGHGHIARGRTGMPDFWEDDTSGSWSGSGAHFFESATEDTFNPTCPGTYDTKRFMGLFGYRHVPSGIAARYVLTHRP